MSLVVVVTGWAVVGAAAGSVVTVAGVVVRAASIVVETLGGGVDRVVLGAALVGAGAAALVEDATLVLACDVKVDLDVAGAVVALEPDFALSLQPEAIAVRATSARSARRDGGIAHDCTQEGVWRLGIHTNRRRSEGGAQRPPAASMADLRHPPQLMFCATKFQFRRLSRNVLM
jgi:hypothetical protein